jgi:hypothetical protein
MFLERFKFLYHGIEKNFYYYNDLQKATPSLPFSNFCLYFFLFLSYAEFFKIKNFYIIVEAFVHLKNA